MSSVKPLNSLDSSSGLIGKNLFSFASGSSGGW